MKNKQATDLSTDNDLGLTVEVPDLSESVRSKVFYKASFLGDFVRLHQGDLETYYIDCLRPIAQAIEKRSDGFTISFNPFLGALNERLDDAEVDVNDGYSFEKFAEQVFNVLQMHGFLKWNGADWLVKDRLLRNRPHILLTKDISFISITRSPTEKADEKKAKQKALDEEIPF